jgi:hypothetical protein
MHPMSRLGNGDRPSRRMRRKVLQLTLVAACLMPLPAAADDETAAFDAVTGPIAALNAGLLADDGDLWKAIDIMLDASISQVAVQRSQFYAVLADGGVAKLIASLRGKTTDLSAGALGAPGGDGASGTPR